MSLTLYLHPLSSFCHKALIPLYENGTAFRPHTVNLGDEASAAEFKKIWPLGKFPVLRDDARGRTVPESTIIIEYLDQYYPGATRFIPADGEIARQTRFLDRFFDLHLHLPMQDAVGDRLRPKDKRDAFGVEKAKARMHTALQMIERDMDGKTWAMGDAFTLADCAAAPALFFANWVMPLAGTYKNAAAYLERLKARPSYARALKEAEPYFDMFPKE